MQNETNNSKFSRRNLFALTACAALTVAGTTADAQIIRPIEQRRERRKGTFKRYPNEHFYTNGKFDEEKARDVVIEFLKHHGYPVYPGLREKIWTSDYGLGKFADVGLSCVGFANKKDGENNEFSYMLQDLFLLPNQMLPEHWHVQLDDKKKHGAQKDEGWVIRWGRSYVVGEGEANLPEEVKVPAAHGDVTVKHVTVADPGVFVPLSSRGSHHWQFAGKNGAILSEVANYHDNASVRHQNKTANDDFLKGVK